MKKLLKLSLIILFIINIFFLLRYSINFIAININNNTIYLLHILNINEPYIVYYNEGNINYNNKEYSKAINNYKKALSKNPPKNKICDIKYNLILSIIKSNSKTKNINNYFPTDECIKYYDNKISSKQLNKLKESINNISKSNDSNTNRNIIDLNNNSTKNRFKEINNYKLIDEYNFYAGKKW